MTEYPYDDRDLFAEPENYFYAKCDHRDYLESWKRSRERAISRLKARNTVSAPSGVISVSDPQGGENAVSLVEVLVQLHQSLSGTDPDFKNLKIDMDFLVVKFEVFKQLDCFYSSRRFRLKDRAPACVDQYILFAKCLVLFMEKTGNLKYLSTMIKLCDAFMNNTFDLTDENVKDIINVWQKEVAFVAQAGLAA